MKQTVVAVDGADGLAIAEGDHFDVLVLDVMLPKMNGLEIVRRLRQQRNTTPILLLTARDKTSDIVGGLYVGADDYLTKPFS
ncbi:MAG TPA: response regulator, partial [Vicinamibacterales bacterium]|nr:response regulator [Vicinamibacterales bacterium]